MLYPEPSSTGKPRLSPWRRFLGSPWLLAGVLFAVALTLYTRHNDFPYTYHPDEYGKVTQLMNRERNFHHPLLLLNLTDWTARVTFTERTPQNLVVVGRWVSAALAVVGITALGMLAWLRYGALAGWAAGLLLIFEAELFKTAHYLKEDPALLFGIAVSLVAAQLWWQRPGRNTLLFLGAACALAAGGKYLGIVCLLFALPLVWWRKPEDPALSLPRRWKTFALAFFITFLVVNLPVPVKKVSSPFRQINREMEGVIGGHRGLNREVPHSLYVGILHGNTPAPLPLFAGIYVLALAATARRRTPVEWLTVVFPTVYFIVLSFSPKVADRYLLPVDVLVTFLAALGAAEIARAIDAPSSGPRSALSALTLVAATAWMLMATVPTFRSLLHEYQTDDHAAIAAWVKANLPADAIIAEDHRVNLSARKSGGLSTTARVPQKVLNDDFAADTAELEQLRTLKGNDYTAANAGTLDALRDIGVTHVAISPDAFKRFFDPDIKPNKKEQAEYDRRKAFYAQLFTEGECLVAWPRSEITYLHPGILLYRLPPVAARESTPTVEREAPPKIQED